MALLDRIQKMKQAGMSESQLTTTLMQEGISPKEVNEALGQSKIKSAIYSEEPAQKEPEMQQSIMEQPSEQATQESQVGTPNTGYQQQNYNYPQQSETQNYYQNPNQVASQEGYSQQAYDPTAYAQDPNQQAYAQDPNQPVYYQQAMDMETVRDIARQEIEDNLKKVRQEIDTLNKIKTELKFEVQGMDTRLARIEAVIQELQSAIIRKMGEYGEAISGISQEVRATQNSFSKMINPIIDKKRGYEEQNQEQVEQEKENQLSEQEMPKQFKPKKPQQAQENPSKNHSKNDSKVSVEDYFR
jgi:hypothetical protein